MRNAPAIWSADINVTAIAPPGIAPICVPLGPVTDITVTSGDPSMMKNTTRGSVDASQRFASAKCISVRSERTIPSNLVAFAFSRCHSQRSCEPPNSPPNIPRMAQMSGFSTIGAVAGIKRPFMQVNDSYYTETSKLVDATHVQVLASLSSCDTEGMML
eukprot:6188379-Amphidinium_carterae.1